MHVSSERRRGSDVSPDKNSDKMSSVRANGAVYDSVNTLPMIAESNIKEKPNLSFSAD